MPKDYAHRITSSRTAPWLTLTVGVFLIAIGSYSGFHYIQKHIHWSTKKAPSIASKSDIVLIPPPVWQATLHGGYFFIGGKENINDSAVAKTDLHTFYGPYLTLNQATHAYNDLIQLSSDTIKLQFIPAQFPKEKYYSK